MVVAHVGSVACMLGIALGTPTEALAGIFIYQVLSGMSSPGVFAMSQILAGPGAAGRWVGIQNACGNFAGVIAPALTGLLVQQTRLREGDARLAAEQATEILRVAPGHPHARLILGAALRIAGQTQAALELLEPLAREQSAVGAVFLELGAALAESDRGTEAITA